ncbi:uncharacterized protein AB675_3990 [Cyphellophora attinorum]|uniref:Uncharacterized protein n=1 Tax=Cyphellophora attinorum TaxID=1664694 RepID=A0A0N1HQ53_9EURO|nr:uncharacterized protein AB675_3990 [Phialophora attinorum]KPI37532.1 hypothetical protein AB675_3990 [Phialophora attinorum]
MPRPIAKVADGGTFLVGLASEVNAGNKARKAANKTAESERQQQGVANYPSTSSSGPQYSYVDGPPPSYDDAVDGHPGQNPPKSFADMGVPLPHSSFSLQQSVNTPIHPLPYPVILPQRRPNNRSRGFVQAYPPDLGTYKGIDEITFLQFLAEFHKSSQASKAFTAVNVAAMVAGFTPGMIAFAVSNAVAMTSAVGQEYHGRYRTNSYLDKANEEFFHPRNLHCMVMTFKRDDPNVLLDIDGQTGSSKGVQAGGPISKLSLKAKSLMGADKPKTEGTFRTSDGVTEGELSLPQAAELVYPTAATVAAFQDDSSSDDEGSEKAKKQPSVWKTMGNSAGNYIDRREQAKFAAEHGSDSRLAMPGATDSSNFASKYSDPSYVNPVTSGLSNLSLRGSGRDRGLGNRLHGIFKSSRQPSPNAEAFEQHHGQDMKAPQLHKKKGVGPMLGTLMAEDVLYLLIAELPSKEERNAILHQAT